MRKTMPVVEPDICGYLQVKRKMFWVIRYAEIINNSFYYYYNKGDSKPRGVFTLYGSKSVDQQTSDNEYIIQFTASKLQQNQRILIRCDKSSDHHNWLSKLIVLSQIPSNQSMNTNNILSIGDNEMQWSQTQLQRKQNQGYDMSQRSETESVQNMESSNPIRQLYPHMKVPSQLLKANNQPYANNENNNYAHQFVKYVEVQQDTCKANPYVFDNNFLTDKTGNQNAILPLKTNIQTALEHFKDCNILTDIDKNIRLYCSKASMESSFNQERRARNNNSSKKGCSISDQTAFLTQFVNQYLDSAQLKIAMVFVSVIVGMIIYQGLQILDTTNLILTLLILLNLIFLPLIARKVNELTYQSEKKKMKQIRQGVIAEYYFPHNVNELLFALTKQFEKRKDWQLTVQKCKQKSSSSNPNEFVTTYYHGEPETFTQHVIRDKDTVFLTEQSSNGFLRIFQMPANSQIEHGVNIKYYFYSPFTKISDMNNNPNSPLLLYGINFFLKQQKRSPFSSLFAYYNQSLECSTNNSVTNLQALNLKGNNQVGNNEQQSNNNQSIKTATSSKNIEAIKIDQEIKQTNNNNKVVTNNQEEERQKIDQQPTSQNNQQNKQDQQQEEIEESKNDPPKKEENNWLEGEYGKKYNAKLKEVIDLMKTQVTLDPANKWKVEDNKPDYKTHTKIDEATGSVMSRGEVNIKKSAKEIVDYIQDASTRKNWDEMYKQGKQVEELSDKCRIEHNVFNGIFPVSDRDFCLLQISLQIGNIYYLLATSVEHPQVPEVKKPVRASLKIGGWVITQISQSECNCVYLTCSDLNGSIPQKIKDIAAKKQSMNAFKLKKIMEK